MSGIAVYVHVPFCTVKCGYCDFNAYAGMDGIKGAYTEAVVREVEAWGKLLPGRRIGSVSFGGGTPGEMAPTDITAILGAVRSAWPLEDGAEVSLEANPGTSNLPFLDAVARAGVNRVSFGAQSFDARELAFLDRIHSPEAIVASVNNARDAGVASVGLDLIYGLPGHGSGETWLATLERALSLEPDHVSCYALTVEEGTALAARVRRGEVSLPDEDQVADRYEEASAILAGAGYLQYEISNWARPGHESRHNRVYWTDGPYLGVGAGAHGYLDGERYENVAHPRAYIAALGSQTAGIAGPAVLERYVPDRVTAMVDYLSLGLRLLEGVSSGGFRRRFGADLAAVAGPALAPAVEAGLVAADERGYRLVGAGRLLHGEISARLLVALRGA